MQNIEQSIRAIYESDGFNNSIEGRCKYYLETGDYSVFTEEELDKLRVFLSTDQSGAEALIVAYDCEAKDYRQLFINNIKVHVYVALKLFLPEWKKEARENRLPMDDSDIDILSITPIIKLKLNPLWRDLDLLIKSSDNWPKEKRYYYFAKQTCHSGNYDIQAPTFRMNILDKSGGKVVISKEDATRFLQTYRGLFPEIPERNNRIRQQVDQTKMLFNMFGHPYIITNYNILESTYKEFYAWGPQSTVGEITLMAFTSMQEYIEQEKLRWDNLHDGHDSFMNQCPIPEAQQCKDKMQEFINIEMTSPIDDVKFRMKSDTKIGFNMGPYYDNEPTRNPLGLRGVKWL